MRVLEVSPSYVRLRPLLESPGWGDAAREDVRCLVISGAV